MKIYHFLFCYVSRLKGKLICKTIIDNSPYCIKEPVELKGNWHNFLGNNNPIHIEVGMGKGRLAGTAARTLCISRITDTTWCSDQTDGDLW